MGVLRIAIFVTLCGSLIPAQSRPTTKDPLRLVRTIELPGVKGRIDHFAVDEDGKRLFICALANDTVEVVDLATGKRSATWRGFHKPQGCAWLPDQKELVVANAEAKDGADVVFVAPSEGKIVGSVKAGADADNIRVDPKTGRVWVGVGESDTAALVAIDPVKRAVVTTVRLAEHPESFQLEPEGARIFVNIADRAEVAVVDRAKGSVVATWKLGELTRNFPMALDADGGRLFVGCRKPCRLAVIDTKTGTLIASPEVDNDTDDVFFDTQRKRLYVSCGIGVLDVLSTATNSFDRVAAINTDRGARTAFFVAGQNRVYVAAPDRKDSPARILEYQVEN